MIKLIKVLEYKDNEIEKKPKINYKEILESIEESVSTDNVVLSDVEINDKDNDISLTALITISSCKWSYNLSCVFTNNNNSVVDYSISISPKNTYKEASPSDISALSNVLNQIDEIMSV